MRTAIWKYLKILAIFTAFQLGSSSLALAQFERGAMRGAPAERFVKKALDQLDLTEEQRSKIQDLHQSRQEQAKAMRQTQQEARQRFQAAIQNSQLSEEELREQHEQFIAAKTSMMRQRFEHMLQIRSVLTAEQRQAFQSLMQEKRGNKGHKKWNRSKNPPLESDE